MFMSWIIHTDINNNYVLMSYAYALYVQNIIYSVIQCYADRSDNIYLIISAIDKQQFKHCIEHRFMIVRPAHSISIIILFIYRPSVYVKHTCLSSVYCGHLYATVHTP